MCINHAESAASLTVPDTMRVRSRERNVLIIIPSLKPNNKLLQLLGTLHVHLRKEENAKINAKILIVDDGSGPEYAGIFEQTQKQYGCLLLRHAVNLGKGRALKTAFNYFLNEFPDFCGVVTVDSDGQHEARDVIRCAGELLDESSLILGCRDFDKKDIPLKSFIGNKLTRSIFRFLCGVSVSDTQTGLRAIPTKLLKRMITVPGERFEYEMNMLIDCGNANIHIKQVRIETIYSDNNRGTYFNPFTDSIGIYKTFFKYFVSALSSFLIDIFLYAIFVSLTRDMIQGYILVATVMARILSSLYNYLINNKIVFKGKKGKKTVLKYYLLTGCQMLASGLLTTLMFHMMHFGEIFSKILVDTVLFLASFVIQREWVFLNKK